MVPAGMMVVTRKSRARSAVEIFRYDRGERLVQAYGSHGFRATRIAAGEVHTSGTEAGLTALAVEGGPLDLFEPETPD